MNVYLMHGCMNAYERLAGLTPRKLHGVYVCPSGHEHVKGVQQ